MTGPAAVAELTISVRPPAFDHPGGGDPAGMKISGGKTDEDIFSRDRYRIELFLFASIAQLPKIIAPPALDSSRKSDRAAVIDSHSQFSLRRR
jgi:hypothetical protein